MSHHSQHSQPEQQPYVEFQHVYKSFGDHKVLEDVSFQVFPGETLCILGRSGVGKSVSLHHHGLPLRPTPVAWWLRLKTSLKPRRRTWSASAEVTMVFQNGALFDSLTVGET
jgi:phospholipid/cholesterol/gamma-HCH transport system ATP-binding protein